MHIPRAFCLKCMKETLIHTTGARFEVMNNHGPYYKIATDVFACKTCDTRVALPALHAIANPRDEHYDAIRAIGRVWLIR